MIKVWIKLKKLKDLNLKRLLKHQFKDGIFSTSCTEWQACIPLLHLPTNLRGLRILDVGGGGSDLTAKLLRKGADAYAVDTLYGIRKAFSVAVALPFEDNFFDIVSSVDSVLPFCTYNFNILQKVINELIRVKKLEAISNFLIMRVMERLQQTDNTEERIVMISEMN